MTHLTRPLEMDMPMTSTLSPEATFTAADRCDRCGARASVRATLAGGGELQFCNHHATEYAAKLREVAVTIAEDEARRAN